MTSSVPTPAGAPPPLLVRYGNFLFRYRDAAFPLVLVALFVASPPRWPGNSRRADDLLDLAGVLVALAGQAIRAATVGYAYIIRGGRNKQVYAEGLVTRGVFNHCRNPLYVGNLLAWLGVVVASGVLWFLPLAALIFAVEYSLIVRFEEGVLESTFGAEYLAYKARTPRWLPRPPRSAQQGPHAWGEAWRSEVSTLLQYVAVAGALLAKHVYFR